MAESGVTPLVIEEMAQNPKATFASIATMLELHTETLALLCDGSSSVSELLNLLVDRVKKLEDERDGSITKNESQK